MMICGDNLDSLLCVPADTLYTLRKPYNSLILKGFRAFGNFMKNLKISHIFMRKWCSNGVVDGVVDGVVKIE